MHPDWARSLRDQCRAAGVPFFFKQLGEYGPCEHGELTPGPWDWERPPASAFDDYVWRVGKKAAGRLLDGREWNEYPR